MPHPHPTADFWKRKLAAYLHDPPEKALDIAWHRKRAEAHQSGHSLEDAEFAREADHTAAAADRLPWPSYRHLACSFDGRLNHFKHPLGQASLKISPFTSTDIATDKAWSSRPKISGDPASPDFDNRAQFLAYWRLWRWWASDQRSPRDPRLAFLPADTRIPDHTIWAHNSLVSALQGCVEDGKCRPAFLLLNLGPVQEYIAAARRTLDLWSGSYLLSYLIGTGLRHIALNLGPDHVIFPNLCGQPIFDLLLQESVWGKISVIADDPESEAPKIWDSLGYRDGYPRKRLLTPSLPNRFLAIVPAGRAADIGRDVAAVICKTHAEIANEVWKLASAKLGTRIDSQRDRFVAQSSRFLDLSWQTLPWDDQPALTLGRTAHLPKPDSGDTPDGHRFGLETVLELARNMPPEHRDVRNFECERFPAGTRNSSGRDISGWKDKSKLRDGASLDNPGAAWSALYALLNWQLDAVRQTRAWAAWETADRAAALDNNKDSLNGREEAVLNLGTDAVSEANVEAINNTFEIPHLFKKGELLGASSLIKRLWPTAWLQPQHDFRKAEFSAPDTRDIANGQPCAMSGDNDRPGDRDNDKAYFAVLAFDGDEMGKWISGTHPRMPTLSSALADYTDGGENKGSRRYFDDFPLLRDLLERPRPLNPSFHLQFSEMLGNFSNLCARRVVEAFDGYLFYSGGDDVLAMLPANRALQCAQTLRAAFRGTKDLNDVRGAWKQAEGKADLRLFDVSQEGFIQLHKEALSMDGEPKNFPAIVPGPAADCSVGIAIAHFKSPLQDVVRAAQAAEKRAKGRPENGGLGRSAVAISLFKRSGEILEWGTKWDKGGLPLFDAIAAALDAKRLRAKFPHRLCEILTPFITQPSAHQGRMSNPIQDLPNFPTDEIIRREFARCIGQHADKENPPEREELIEHLERYLKSMNESKLRPSQTLEAVIGLLTAVAFARRTSPEKASTPATILA